MVVVSIIIVVIVSIVMVVAVVIVSIVVVVNLSCSYEFKLVSIESFACELYF